MCEVDTAQSAVSLILLLLQGSDSKRDERPCRACDASCVDCRGPSMWNCTVCPALQILSDDGRCLSCCGNEKRQDDVPISRQCCDCEASRGNTQITEACGLISLMQLALHKNTNCIHTFPWNKTFMRVSLGSQAFRTSAIRNGCPTNYLIESFPTVSTSSWLTGFFQYLRKIMFLIQGSFQAFLASRRHSKSAFH